MNVIRSHYILHLLSNSLHIMYNQIWYLCFLVHILFEFRINLWSFKENPFMVNKCIVLFRLHFMFQMYWFKSKKSWLENAQITTSYCFFYNTLLRAIIHTFKKKIWKVLRRYVSCNENILVILNVNVIYWMMVLIFRYYFIFWYLMDIIFSVRMSYIVFILIRVEDCITVQFNQLYIQAYVIKIRWLSRDIWSLIEGTIV